MPSLLVPSVPFYRNPQLRPGLAALVEFLMGRDYSSHAIGRIFDFVACNGTLEGSLVEPEDMADAEAAFVDSLPEIPFNSTAWGEPDEGPDAPDADPHCRFPGIEPLARRRYYAAVVTAIPPVSGGSPEYEPSPEDLADYGAWSDALDRRRDVEDQRRWYAAHPLAEFNALRND